MRAKAGFTVLEVVVASSVLIMALVGVMSGAFAVLKTSKSSDLAMQASNLAAERLAYFRSCPNPYIAVGGTYYPAPENPRTHRDYNTEEYRGDFHNVWNQSPILLVREWLYDPAQTTARSALTGANPTNNLTRKFAQIAAPAADNLDRRLNAIPPMPETVQPGGGVIAKVAGVFPDWRNNAKSGPTVVQQPIFVNSPPGGEPAAPRVAFIPAPMANEALRGRSNITDGSGALNELPRTVKFVREVWVQTNSPLGPPFGSVNRAFVDDQGYADPALAAYGTAGVGAPGLNTFTRIVNGPAADGTMAMDVPLWVVTVTVRVFQREPRIRFIENSANVAGSSRSRGIGYDPTKPLATMIGYFSLRRNF